MDSQGIGNKKHCRPHDNVGGIAARLPYYHEAAQLTEPPRGSTLLAGAGAARLTRHELQPVEINEIARLAAGELDIEGVPAEDRPDIAGHGLPALPAPGVSDG